MTVDVGGAALLEIGTFLARRWSEDSSIRIALSTRPGIISTRHLITVPSPEVLAGDGLGRYRQFRTAVWREAQRLRLCDIIQSNDHAFGFVLNTFETRRVEVLGQRRWRGMSVELVHDYAYAWMYRPSLSTVYGRARMAEAFYQSFMFGGIKGELQQSHREKVSRAVAIAKEALEYALARNRDTVWLETKVSEMIRALEIDSLMSIPLSVPGLRGQMPLDEKEIKKTISMLSSAREGDFGRIKEEDARAPENLKAEFAAVSAESRRGRIPVPATVGIRVPSSEGADESSIHDSDLINGLKTRFRAWRTHWTERYGVAGAEFDPEAYIEGAPPMLVDKKSTIKTDIVMLLDHSSSIAGEEKNYKKAALALCEVLSFIGISFSVYAFNTEKKEIVCWMIKSRDMRWDGASARRLARIAANGSTPLAEVYQKMLPALEVRRPKIFLTLTDGEPSDSGAVQSMTRAFRAMGIRMVALGLGRGSMAAVGIARNLGGLGYERTLAVGRLDEIPRKVLGILGEEGLAGETG